jgi:lipopolysaccharide export system permease protein
MINLLDTYLVKLFLKKILILILIFFLLIFILTIFEEITFFSEKNTNFFLPFLTSFLNVPTSLFEIFPFIAFIGTQLFFLEIFKKKENELIKINGKTNLFLIKILTISSFVFGILTIIIYYPISSKLKYFYNDIKNSYSSDGKYLKYFSNNSLWIKDEIDGFIYIINGNLKKNDFIENIFISKFDENFKLIENIFSKKADISENVWKLEKPQIFNYKNQILNPEIMEMKSNFNVDKINNTFSNLYALNYFELIKLKRENLYLGYTTEDIDFHLLKIFLLPIFLTLLVIISSIIMLNIKKNRPYLFHVIFGILISVIIHYSNNLFKVMGLTGKISINMSVLFPLIILLLITLIGLVRINEK